MLRPGTGTQAGGGNFRDLFRRVTGGASGLMKRNLGESGGAVPAQVPLAQPAVAAVAARIEPDLAGGGAAPVPAAPRAAQQPPDGMGLDIPTFLRRQSN